MLKLYVLRHLQLHDNLDKKTGKINKLLFLHFLPNKRNIITK